MPQPQDELVKRTSTKQRTSHESEILNAGNFTLTSADAHILQRLITVGSSEKITLDKLDLSIGPFDDPVDVEEGYLMAWMARTRSDIGPVVGQTKDQLIDQAVFFEKQRWRTLGGGDTTVDVYKNIELDFSESDNAAENTRQASPNDYETLCLIGFSNVGFGHRFGWAGELEYRRTKFQRQFRDRADDWAGYEFHEQLQGMVY